MFNFIGYIFFVFILIYFSAVLFFWAKDIFLIWRFKLWDAHHAEEKEKLKKKKEKKPEKNI